MKLSYPTKRVAVITQGFNQNANPLYASQGLTGHSGIDIGGAFGASIFAAIDCYLYSTINIGASPDSYRAVYTIIDEEEFSYEVTYGHIIDCPHELKQFVKKGDLIARMGNFGDVFTGGRKVTKEERENGSTAGTHLHLQSRKCKRVKKRSSRKQYLRDADGLIILNGVYYEIQDYDNGVNGCVDIEWTGEYADEKPVSNKPKFTFTRSLKVGSRGSDVKALQDILVYEGFLLLPHATTEYFGGLTRSALVKWQEKYAQETLIPWGLTKGTGFAGSTTIAQLNKLFG